MQHIYHLLTIGLLWLHVAALTSVTGRIFGSWAIGRAVGITLFVMVGFFVEHIVGLGSLRWVLPFSTALAALCIWINKDSLRGSGFLKGEILFGVALLYGILWKELFPNIYITSERIPDMVFIVNFLPGDRLPPLDAWNPPYLFDYYYSLQYYAAGLAARILHMSPGLAYNICFALIPALTIPLIWDFAARFVKSRASKILLVTAMTIGGTGASIFTHVAYQAPPGMGEWERYNAYVMASSHLVGEFDQQVNTPLGKALFPPLPPGKPLLRMGMENFGFQYPLGDYHAPMGGYFLLLLAIALIGAMEASRNVPQPAPAGAQNSLTPRQERWLYASLGLTIPAIFATNTWVFPFQVVLVGGWVMWRVLQGVRHKELRPDWTGLLIGGVGGFLLIYFFLIGFVQARDPTPIQMVPEGLHTPVRQFVAMFWPLLAMIALGLWQRQTRRLSLFFAAVFAFLLLFSEMFHTIDGWGDYLERTNETLKWWGWVWTGGIASLGALLLAAQSRAVRICTWVILGATLTYTYDIVTGMYHLNEHTFGHLEGSYIHTRDPQVRDMFRYLEVAPYGIVLENQYEGAYHDGGNYAAFSGKPLLLGWWAHIDRWRGESPARQILLQQITAFYNGTLEQPRQWLEGKNVSYVVWNPRDSGNSDAWGRINAELQSSYNWEAFGQLGEGRPVGIWVRKSK